MIDRTKISNKAGAPDVVVRVPGGMYRAPPNMTRSAATEWAIANVQWYHRRSFLESYKYGGDERDSEGR